MKWIPATQILCKIIHIISLKTILVDSPSNNLFSKNSTIRVRDNSLLSNNQVDLNKKNSKTLILLLKNWCKMQKINDRI